MKDEEEPSVGAALPEPVKEESDTTKDDTQSTTTEKAEVGQIISAADALKVQVEEDQTVSAPAPAKAVGLETEKVIHCCV